MWVPASSKIQKPRNKTRPAGFKLVSLAPETLSFLEFLIKLVDPSCGIHKFHLAGEKGMRFVGNLQLDQRIFLAVVPYNRVFGGRATTAEEGFVR